MKEENKEKILLKIFKEIDKTYNANSLSKELDLPVIDVSDNESNYRPGFGGLTGTFVGSEIAREKVLDLLGEKVFKTEEYAHRYPTCWRCKSELIFRVVDEWYISMKKIRKDLVKTAKKIKWIPSFSRVSPRLSPPPSFSIS